MPQVRILSLGPCKDGYSDTMGIGIIVLYFCQKPLKIADFITLLRKAPPLTRQKAGPETVAFCFLGVIWVWLSLIYWSPLFYWSNRSITILQGNLQRISRFFQLVSCHCYVGVLIIGVQDILQCNLTHCCLSFFLHLIEISL